MEWRDTIKRSISNNGRRPSVPGSIATDCAGVLETGVGSGSDSCAACRSSVVRHHFRESDHRVPLPRDQLWHVSVVYRLPTRGLLNVQLVTSMAQFRHFLSSVSNPGLSPGHGNRSLLIHPYECKIFRCGNGVVREESVMSWEFLDDAK